MDYKVHFKDPELSLQGELIEIGPGQYTGKHWNPDHLYLWEEAFGLVEGVVAKHFPAFDHFAMNDIPKKIGLQITREWRHLSDQIGSMLPYELEQALRLDLSFRNYDVSQFEHHRVEITVMLRELADRCDEFYQTSEWICILGI
ncbi:MAG: hypothetical protein ACK4UN_19490 [Limisphaerales bacterium]